MLKKENTITKKTSKEKKETKKVEKVSTKKPIKKKNIILLIVIVFVIGLLASAGAAYVTASTVVSSKEVKFDNSTGGIQSTNLQDAIVELNNNAEGYSNIISRVNSIGTELYPVGSIFISVTNTNPSTFIGGTWVAFGTGRTLIGVDTSNGNFNTVEKTGGSQSVTLSVNNIPAHTHSIPALSGTAASAGAHTHSWSGTTSSAGAHTHTWSGTTSSAGAHTHTWSGTTSSAGAHTHTVTEYYANTTTGSTTIDFANGYAKFDMSTSGYIAFKYKSVGSYTANWTANSGFTNYSGTKSLTDALELGGSQAHTHSVSNTSASRTTSSAGAHTHTYSGTTSSNGAHTHTYSGTTSSNGAHTHTVSGDTGSAGAHTHTVSTTASTTGSTGSTSSFSILNPYITVYMWKRTA